MLEAPGVNDEPLVAALIEIERFVGRAGWDQPARLFGLVPTVELIEAEPHLADQLTVSSDDALSSVEQQEFNPTGDDPLRALVRIAWSPAIAGCALSIERSFLSVEDGQIPDDVDEAAEYVAHHPKRQDIRVVAGAYRHEDGKVTTACVARVASQPDELLVGADMVPALTQALAMTLTDTQPRS